MAMASDLVTADCVEAQEFLSLSRAYGISAVPKTILNGKAEILGAQPESVLLAGVLEAGGAGGA